MKIAIPTSDGVLSAHFGYCQEFVLVEVDPSAKKTINSEKLVPPGHQPGALPQWLNQQGVTHIIVGGIGHRAIQFFDQMGIKVIAGAPELPVEEIIAAWLDGKLEANYVPCEGHGPYYGEGHGGHENK